MKPGALVSEFFYIGGSARERASLIAESEQS